MSNRDNSSNILPFIFIAAFFAIAIGTPGPLVFGVIAYVMYRMFSNSSRRDRRSRGEDRDFERGRRPNRSRQYEPRRRTARPPYRQPAAAPRPKNNPFKISGIKKYKDYNYEGAIEDFKKALSVDPEDIAVHFNIACAYSIMEQPHLALIHLDKAVKSGFKDFEKIKTHDALAFVRIQEEYDHFVQNGYQLAQGNAPQEEKINQSDSLLEQLQKLAELREKGLLTEEEFLQQKKKLLK